MSNNTGLFTVKSAAGQTMQAKQLPRMTKEEISIMQVVSYGIMPMLIKELGKPARGAFLAVSEALAAYKAGEASEGATLLAILSSDLDQLRNKEAMIKELYEAAKEGTLFDGQARTNKVEEFWMFIRTWAKVPLANAFLERETALEEMQSKAMAWWGLLEEQRVEKEEESKEERHAKLMHKARFGPGELTNEEAEWLMENSDDEGMAMFDAQLARKADLASAGKLKAGMIDATDL